MGLEGRVRGEKERQWGRVLGCWIHRRFRGRRDAGGAARAGRGRAAVRARELSG